MSKIETIALFGAGDMGGGVGRTLVEGGFRVVSDLAPRSPASRARAEAAGVEDMGGLKAALAAADIALSVMPPGNAAGFADQAAAAMADLDRKPVFADLNAISPKTMAGIASAIEGAGGVVLDGGILGPSPNKGRPRIYLSGPLAAEMAPQLERPDMQPIALGPDIGQASAMKMLYAGTNKGYWAMLAGICMAAKQYGLFDAFMAELEANNTAVFKTLDSWVGFLAADAHRFGPEMDEIAEAMSAVGVTPHFHQGARWIYDLLDETPLRTETRATWDRDRPLGDSVRIYVEALEKRAP